MPDRTVSHLSVVLLLAMSATPAVAELPRRVEVTYEVAWNGMNVGRSTEKMEHDGRRYQIVSDLQTVGLAAIVRKLNIHVESSGLILKGALQPVSYSEERTRKPRRSARFDWNTRQVTLESGQGPQVIALPDHPVFDRASFAWSFAFSPPTAQEGRIGVTDGRKLSAYRYQIVGKETIKTPAGAMETLRVRKVQEAGDERGFEVWLATQKHYLPVRVLFKDDDNTVDSVVSAFEFPAKP